MMRSMLFSLFLYFFCCLMRTKQSTTVIKHTVGLSFFFERMTSDTRRTRVKICLASSISKSSLSFDAAKLAIICELFVRRLNYFSLLFFATRKILTPRTGLRGGEGADGGQQFEGGADRRDVVDYHGALAVVVAHRYAAKVHLHVGHHAPEGG